MDLLGFGDGQGDGMSDHVPRKRRTRKQDPRWSTSDEAYDRSRASEPTMTQKVIALLKEAPRTCDEVQALLDGTHQSVSPVFTKLGKDGVIEDTGTTRLTRSNRPAVVWRIAGPKPLEDPPTPAVPLPLTWIQSLFPVQPGERRMT